MSEDKVRVAIVGVGNCASALVQGVHYYKNAGAGEQIPGIMHADLGGYQIKDIEFTAAFDVVTTKVGLDLSQAINQSTDAGRQISAASAQQAAGLDQIAIAMKSVETASRQTVESSRAIE